MALHGWILFHEAALLLKDLSLREGLSFVQYLYTFSSDVLNRRYLGNSADLKEVTTTTSLGSSEITFRKIEGKVAINAFRIANGHEHAVPCRLLPGLLKHGYR